MGLMLAVIMVLSTLEHMLPPIPFMPPNVRLGLSNIVTMYCVFFIGKPQAVALNAMKSVFIFLIRGPMAGLLSFSGGMLSILTIILLIFIFKNNISYITVSIVAAIMHNIGQLLTYSLIFQTDFVFYYLPVLLVSGVILGIITGTMLKVLLPVLNKVLK